MNERIRELFVKKMGLILDKRKTQAAQAATRVRSEANGRGMLHSSETELGVKSAYEEIYEIICREAWSELQQIAVTIGVGPDESLADELRAVFDQVMEPLAGRYLGELARLRSTAGAIAGDIAGDAETAFRRSREIVGTEIEVFSNKAETTVSQRGDNIHIKQTGSGTVVAVQQGDHSTATVTQNVDTAGLETLRSTLESLLETFRNHEQLAPLIEEAKAGGGQTSAGVGTHPKSAKRDQDVDRHSQEGQGALRNGRECGCRVRHGGATAHTAVDRGACGAAGSAHDFE